MLFHLKMELQLKLTAATFVLQQLQQSLLLLLGWTHTRRSMFFFFNIILIHFAAFCRVYVLALVYKSTNVVWLDGVSCSLVLAEIEGLMWLIVSLYSTASVVC